MIAYKKPSPGTTVEVAEGNILPVDRFGTLEVNLDQLGNTTKLVRMDAVACVLELSRNLLSTLKAVSQWGKLLFYYIKRLFWGSGGRSRSVVTSAPGLFSATGKIRIPSKVARWEEVKWRLRQ